MKTIILAIISSVFTLAAWLWWNGTGISIGNEEFLMKKMSLFSLSFGEDFAKIPNDYLFINTNNDLQLVDIFEEIDGVPLPVGNTAITDREKLLKLFQLILESPTYKYIFFDILLDKQYATPVDSVLVRKINATPRLVYAKHDTPLLDGLSSEKEGGVVYKTTFINDDFCKYRLMIDTLPSMAYKAYQELVSKNDKFHLNSFMPILYFNIKQKYSDNSDLGDSFSAKQNILNLGVDVLNPYVDFQKLIENKYIFIGDYNGFDVHTTYLDKMDGIQIHANAFVNLMNGNHKFHPMVILVMGLIIFIFYCMWFSRIFQAKSTSLPIVDNTVGIVKKKFLDRKYVKFFLSFLTIEAIFTILFYFIFFTTDRIVEVTSLSLLFTILWNIPSNKIHDVLKQSKKLMKKFHSCLTKVLVLIVGMVSIFSIAANGENFRILYISTPGCIYSNKERKTAGDIISTDDHLKWAEGKQTMRLQSLSDGYFKVVRNTPLKNPANLSLRDYLEAEPILVGRGEVPKTPESLRAVIPDTLLLLDKIEIPSALQQSLTRFYFIEYYLDGVKIRKKLPVSEGMLTIDRNIYTVDGKEIPPFNILTIIFYYDKDSNTISIVGENKTILPLDL